MLVAAQGSLKQTLFAEAVKKTFFFWSHNVDILCEGKHYRIFFYDLHEFQLSNQLLHQSLLRNEFCEKFMFLVNKILLLQINYYKK